MKKLTLIFICCIGFSTILDDSSGCEDNYVRQLHNFQKVSKSRDWVGPIRHYTHIRDLALSILKRWPPSEHYYMGVGRSLTPIIRFFIELGISAQNFPFSRTWSADHAFELVRQYEAVLLRHFDAFMPSREEVLEKRILMMDFTESGRGLTLFSDLAYWYTRLYSKTLSDRLIMVPFYDPVYFFTMNRAVFRSPETAVELNSTIANAFANMIYKPFAQYHQFHVDFPDHRSTQYHNVLKYTVNNRRYSLFGAVLRSEMMQDKVLIHVLEGIDRHHKLFDSQHIRELHSSFPDYLIKAFPKPSASNPEIPMQTPYEFDFPFLFL